MGQEWDGGDVAFRPETWAEMLRVAKPGAHLLAFGGTRTYHRLACAIEDAGWEVRDSLYGLIALEPKVQQFLASLDAEQRGAFLEILNLIGFDGTLAWMYGSGFPKSLDVSKAIDKARNDDVRHVCRFLRLVIDASEYTTATLAKHFGFNRRMVEHWAARDTDSQPTLPTLSQWESLRSLLGFDGEMDAEVCRLNERKGEFGDAYQSAEVVGRHEGKTPGLAGERFGVRDDLRRAPATPGAQEWQGFGTALKPAYEPIILARKPLQGTVANNVQKYGCGALDIDGSRIGFGEESDSRVGTEAVRGEKRGLNSTTLYGGGTTKGGVQMYKNEGRWPSNVLLDGESAKMLDEQSGYLTSGRLGVGHGSGNSFGVGNSDKKPGAISSEYGNDSGGASRFFYTSKARQDERPEVDGVSHPTVKPLDLMRYLVGLVSREGDMVLDPFAGSGTTGAACVGLGRNVVMCELNPEYVKLVERRMETVTPSLFSEAE